MRTETVQLPAKLAEMPVGRGLSQVDHDKQYLIVSSGAGNGKSLGLPALEALLRRDEPGVVVTRQPNRLTCNSIKAGIEHFWGDRIKVVVRTSDDKDPKGLDDADLVLISDGSLRPLMQRREVAAYYCDEAHDMSNPLAEIDLGIAKEAGLPIRLMSATIDPARFQDYLPGADYIEMEGKMFPVEKRLHVGSPNIFKRSDLGELKGVLNGIVLPALAEGERILVALPTKQMCEDMAKQMQFLGHTSKFIHADVDAREVLKWTRDHGDEPWVAYATTANIKTGITLDVGVVVAADDIIYGGVKNGRKNRTAGPLNDNDLIQVLGRAGRIKPGVAHLVTADGRRPVLDADEWYSPVDAEPIRPRPIAPPCETNTPIDVQLAFASQGVSLQDADILSNLDMREMRSAARWLLRTGCIDNSGGITRIGRSVERMSLDTLAAHLCLTAPSKPLKLASLAAIILGDRGSWQMVEVKPERAHELHGKPFLPPSCVVENNMPATLANIMHGAIRARTMFKFDEWCQANNLRPAALKKALWDFNRACPKSISDSPFDDLSKLEFDPAALAVHMKQHPLFTQVLMRGEKQADYGAFPHFYDKVAATAWSPPAYHMTWGIFEEVTTAKGFSFNAVGMPISSSR